MGKRRHNNKKKRPTSKAFGETVSGSGNLLDRNPRHPPSDTAFRCQQKNGETDVDKDEEDFQVNTFLKRMLRASIEGPKDMAEALVAKQWVPNENEQFHLACELGESQIVARMLQSSNHKSRQSYVDMRYKDGSTPLIIASTRGHASVCQLLIDHKRKTEPSRGIDLNTKWVGNTGTTPLILGANTGTTR